MSFLMRSQINVPCMQMEMVVKVKSLRERVYSPPDYSVPAALTPALTLIHQLLYFIYSVCCNFPVFIIKLKEMAFLAFTSFYG